MRKRKMASLLLAVVMLLSTPANSVLAGEPSGATIVTEIVTDEEMMDDQNTSEEQESDTSEMTEKSTESFYRRLCLRNLRRFIIISDR